MNKEAIPDVGMVVHAFYPSTASMEFKDSLIFTVSSRTGRAELDLFFHFFSVDLFLTLLLRLFAKIKCKNFNTRRASKMTQQLNSLATKPETDVQSLGPTLFSTFGAHTHINTHTHKCE